MKLYYFTASYCQPCKTFLPTVEKVCEATGTELVKIDAESDEAQVYGIRGVPTIILMDGTQVIDRRQGVMSESALKGMLS